MSEEKNRSIEEIEADLARTRLELTTTVNELSERLDPRRQVQILKEEAAAVLTEARDQAKEFVERLKKGDSTALSVVGAGVAVTTVVIVLVVRRGHDGGKSV